MQGRLCTRTAHFLGVALLMRLIPRRSPFVPVSCLSALVRRFGAWNVLCKAVDDHTDDRGVTNWETVSDKVGRTAKACRTQHGIIRKAKVRLCVCVCVFFFLPLPRNLAGGG